MSISDGRGAGAKSPPPPMIHIYIGDVYNLGKINASSFILCIINSLHILRSKFWLKREEITGDWRRLCDEDLRNLYPLPNLMIVRMIKSNRMRSAGGVARIEMSVSSATYYGSRAFRCDHSPPSITEVKNGGAIPLLLHMSSWHSA
jgi:hypothetical protein